MKYIKFVLEVEHAGTLIMAAPESASEPSVTVGLSGSSTVVLANSASAIGSYVMDNAPNSLGGASLVSRIQASTQLEDSISGALGFTHMDVVADNADQPLGWVINHMLAEHTAKVAAQAAPSGNTSASAKAAAKPKPKPKRKAKSKAKHVRPNGEEYVARYMQQAGMTDVEAVQTAQAAGMHIYIEGPPGCGKSALTEVAVGYGFQQIAGDQGTQREHLIGAGTYDDNGKPIYVMGPLVRAATHKHDEHCPKQCGASTIYIDEANAIDGDVLIIVNEFADGRREAELPEFDCDDSQCEKNKLADARGEDRISHIHISPDFRMVVTVNPDKPGMQLLDSFKSRCGLKFAMETDYNVARQLGVPDDAVDWAINLAKKRAGGTPMGPLPSMRTLQNFKTNSEVFSTEFAWAAMMNDADDIGRAVWMDVANQIVGGTVQPLVHTAEYR